MDLYKLNTSSRSELVIEADGQEVIYHRVGDKKKRWHCFGYEPQELQHLDPDAKQAALDLLNKYGEHFTICVC